MSKELECPNCKENLEKIEEHYDSVVTWTKAISTDKFIINNPKDINYKVVYTCPVCEHELPKSMILDIEPNLVAPNFIK